MSNVRKPRVWGHPDPEAGPSFAERQQLERLKNLQSGHKNNFDSRFGSPVFKTTNKKKRSLMGRYPWTTVIVMSALTLTAYFGRWTYMMAIGKPTPEEEIKMREVNERISKQLSWSRPIRNTYAKYTKEKEPSQED